jgi:hypothetical protein
VREIIPKSSVVYIDFAECFDLRLVHLVAREPEHITLTVVKSLGVA